MTIEDIRNYAKEMGVAPKKIELLISELNPNENGELSVIESAQAMNTIRFHIATIENIRSVLKATKEMRAKRSKDK